MDNFLDSPWLLRITALFLAILLFVTVQEGKLKGNTSIDDLEVIRDVPVEVFYDNENLVVTGVPETIDITIEGPKNIVQTTVLLKDFSLVVDLRSLPMGEHQVKIQHENLSEKLTVRMDPGKVDVVIEEKITKAFKVEPEFNRQSLAENFNVTSMEVAPSMIEVTGAKSVVEAVSFVKATVSSEQGINQSFEQDARVRVLDRDLNKLDLLIVPENVKVKVNIQENSKEVPLVLNVKGTPPAGVMINDVSAAEEKITLFGPNKVLENIDAFHVDVDVSKVRKSGTIEVELKTPKDVNKISIDKLKVKIEATTENEDEVADGSIESPDSSDTPADEDVVSDTVKIEGVQVAITGLNRQFKGTFSQPSSGQVTLTVTATSDVIGKLEKSDFNVSVDASNVTSVGEYVYPITVKGPGNVRWTLSAEEAILKIELA